MPIPAFIMIELGLMIELGWYTDWASGMLIMLIIRPVENIRKQPPTQS